MTNTLATPSIATYFIGGAADKNRFWYLGPRTNLIRRTLLNRYLDAIRPTALWAMEQNRTIDDAYWGYDEMDALFMAIQKLIKNKPGTQVRLIGHSLGAWQAGKLSSRLAEVGIATALLVSIDPVGIGYFLEFPGNEASLPRPQAVNWINLVANHLAGYTVDDGVADAGIRWRPERDTGLKRKPTLNIETPYSHADVWQMMVFPGGGGKSAWQTLMAVPL